MNSTIKTVAFWAIIVVSAFLLWQVVKTGSNATKEKKIDFSEFLADIDQGNVRDVTFSGQEAKGTLKNPDGPFRTTVQPGSYPELYNKLTAKNVHYGFNDISNGTWPSWILNLAPLVLLGALWFFMIRQMQTGGNKALSFGKSRARLLSMQQKKITFKDVAGVDEAKEELREIIEFLREAQKFQKLGGRIPKGVLLVGPPGTGKTLLARAVAGEANVPFFSISGSDFVEMFVGVGEVACATSSNRARKTLPASSLSTKSTPSDVIAAPASAADTTSASRP